LPTAREIEEAFDGLNGDPWLRMCGGGRCLICGEMVDPFLVLAVNRAEQFQPIGGAGLGRQWPLLP
jgi:hypothetical protein